HIVNALHIHGESLKPVGQLARNGVTLEPADLLEESELADLHPVAPDFPAEPPGAERRAFPVIFNKADIVIFRIYPEGIDALEIEFLNIVRRRFEEHLELVVMLRAVRVLAVAAIGRAAR